MATSTNDCSVHEGVAAAGPCSACDKAFCARCLAWDVDGHVACEACGTRADERSRSFGSAVLIGVAVTYLTALSVGWLVFRARPFVGGLAAVVALVVGRALQAFAAPSPITRRET